MMQPGEQPKHQPATSLLSTPGDTSHDAFARVLATLDDSTDLARPALALAADEYPGFNSSRYLNLLDDLADEALQSVVIGARTDCEAARRLSAFLFQRRGFHGAEGNEYYDPRNSFLNNVLERQVGIPISLSLVLIEVGRRLGMPLVGIGFPGHFLVGCGPHRRNEYLLLDPFSAGKVVDWNECELRLQTLGMEFDPATHLSPVTNREFFLRLLANLKSIYMQRRDVDRVLRTVARMTQIEPDSADEYRQFAAALANDGDFEGARRCLRSYLDVIDQGETADSARKLLSHLLDLRAQRN